MFGKHWFGGHWFGEHWFGGGGGAPVEFVDFRRVALSGSRSSPGLSVFNDDASLTGLGNGVALTGSGNAVNLAGN